MACCRVGKLGLASWYTRRSAKLRIRSLTARRTEGPTAATRLRSASYGGPLGQRRAEPKLWRRLVAATHGCAPPWRPLCAFLWPTVWGLTADPNQGQRLGNPAHPRFRPSDHLIRARGGAECSEDLESVGGVFATPLSRQSPSLGKTAGRFSQPATARRDQKKAGCYSR